MATVGCHRVTEGCLFHKNVKGGVSFFMTSLEDYKNSIKNINIQIGETNPKYDDLYKLLSLGNYILEDADLYKGNREFTEFDKFIALEKTVGDYVKYWANAYREYKDDKFDKLYWFMFLIEAQKKRFDSYMLYLEKNRLQKDKFYEPRRKCFNKIALTQGYQDILDDKLDILSVSMPPGTGKSSIEKMLHSGVAGWFQEEGNLFFSHSGDITRMYYDGVLDIMTNDQEYTWQEIFPDEKITNTNAKMEQINVGKYKPFPNVQCTSVGSSNAGKVRASYLLLCDDLIASIEEALNKNRLDKLWNTYSVDARQRKLDGCKEIHTATRWSTDDVIGRLQKIYDGDDRARFIAVPDIDEKTSESNFDYDTNGFSVAFFNEQAKVMDDISYKCLYKSQPIEREGLLYPEQDVRRYTELPDGEPDEILAQCDTKSKGVDYMVMPILYRYGEDYYCEDAICSMDSDFEKQYENLANILVNNNVQNCDFESNTGGDRVAYEVQKRVEEKGWICAITDTPTESNKEARIFQCSNWIKQHIVFKDKSLYAPKSDYSNMMGQLLSYSVSGKNVNDDTPDVFANFALRMTKAKKQRRPARVLKSPI